MGEIPRLSPSIAEKVLQCPLMGWSAHRLLKRYCRDWGRTPLAAERSK